MLSWGKISLRERFFTSQIYNDSNNWIFKKKGAIIKANSCWINFCLILFIVYRKLFTIANFLL